MVVIFNGILYYYQRGVCITIKPRPSELSVLKVAFPLFLVLAIVHPALLGVSLLQQSASLWGSASSQLALLVFLQFLHDLLGLI